MRLDTHLREGQTLAGSKGPGRFVVLKLGTARDVPYLNGRPLIVAAPLPCSASRLHRPSHGGLEPGACYVDKQTGLEIRCTEAGGGALCYAGRPMTLLPRQLRFPLQRPALVRPRGLGGRRHARGSRSGADASAES